MPAPRWLARLNRQFTNRLTIRLAPRLPGFGVITHTGRRSGARYRTPVNVFARPDASGFVVALTYGPSSDWVRNVLARGEADLKTRGRCYHVIQPRLVRDPRRRGLPLPVRLVLGRLGVDDFLYLTDAGGGRSGQVEVAQQ